MTTYLEALHQSTVVDEDVPAVAAAAPAAAAVLLSSAACRASTMVAAASQAQVLVTLAAQQHAQLAHPAQAASLRAAATWLSPAA
jgi:hypothetical protein